MINIFRYLAPEMKKNAKYSGNTPRTPENAELLQNAGREASQTVRRYIEMRISITHMQVGEKEQEALEYLEMLYFRVMEDGTIPAALRALKHILLKMEEDLAYDVSCFAGRAAFILDFLEVDTLIHAGFKSNNLKEKQVLGRILRLRKQYMGEEERPESSVEELLRPRELKAYLDRFIIGQEDAKVSVSSAVYGHGKRVRHPSTHFAPDIVLLIGSSGCGKTEIMRRIREVTGYPMVMTDVSNLGASQFRGRHKEDILLDLFEKAGRNKNLAEQGIIFMDEFDKLLPPAISERGVDMHDDVQAQLLTMLEGSEVEISSDRQSMLFDTSRVLFVLAGAFQGIGEYIKADKQEKGHSSSMGFFSELEKDMDLSLSKGNINHEVLMKYGMKRELAGRISAITVLDKLDKEDMIRILTQAEDNLVEKYQREIELSCGAALVFTHEALEEVAEQAVLSETGARALQAVMAKAMRKVLYHAPSKKGLKSITVTREVITSGAEPVYEYKSDGIEENNGGAATGIPMMDEGK